MASPAPLPAPAPGRRPQVAADPVWRELVGRPVRRGEARRIASAQVRVHGGTELPHRTHRAIRLRRLPGRAGSPGEVTGQRRPARVAPSGHPAGGRRRGRGPPPGMVRAGASRTTSASSGPDAGSRSSSTARPHASGAPSPSARRQSRTPAPQCPTAMRPGCTRSPAASVHAASWSSRVPAGPCRHAGDPGLDRSQSRSPTTYIPCGRAISRRPLRARAAERLPGAASPPRQGGSTHFPGKGRTIPGTAGPAARGTSPRDGGAGCRPRTPGDRCQDIP